MKKILLLLSFLAISHFTLATPQKWVEIAKHTNGNRFYFDMSHAIKQEDHTARIKIVFGKPSQIEDKTVSSVIAKIKFNCSNHTIAHLSKSLYAENGISLGQEVMPDVQFNEIAPGSIDAIVERLACQ